MPGANQQLATHKVLTMCGLPRVMYVQQMDALIGERVKIFLKKYYVNNRKKEPK